MEYPSFIHTYANLKSPIRTRTGNKRPRGSPTGKTPQQLAKISVFGKENVSSCIKQPWTQEEKSSLYQYVNDNGGVPSSSSDDFWKECATYLQEKYGISRSGDSCRQYFKRVKSLFSSNPPVEPLAKSVKIQTDDIAKPYFSQQTQTVPSIPITGIQKSCLQAQENEYSLSSFDRAALLETVLSGTPEDIVDIIMKISPTRDVIKTRYLQDINNSANEATSNKSVLYKKSYQDLKNFSWGNIVSEMTEKQPELTNMCLTVMTRGKSTVESDIPEECLPKLGMIYAILMQARYHKLSLVQRLLAVILKDEQTHEKVFDRLEPVGITSSYTTLLTVLDEIGNECYENVLSEVENGKRYRLIGDNVNFQVGEKYKRGSDKHSHQYHWFASCAIIQNNNFEEISDEPQGTVKDLDIEKLLPSVEDVKGLKSNYVCLITKIAKESIPALSFLKLIDPVPEHLQTIKQTNQSILLPVLPYNEQTYSDVVKILDSYQESVQEINEKTGTNFKCIQIGGDQLTRERFSGAKGLRAGSFTPRERFDNLSPITFELFHTGMNFLDLMFKVLFHRQGFEKATLNGEKVKINRSCVNEDVKNHYDDDKDFMVSFVKAYIVVALLDFFGMVDINSSPTKNQPPENNDELENWQHDVFVKFIEQFVFAQKQADELSNDTYKSLLVKLPNGSQIEIQIRVSAHTQPNENTQKDHVKSYGVLVLELGLMFMEFLEVCKTPDRNRLIQILKCMMMVFKTVNYRSKYALEILRFLCFQQASYSLRTSYQSIHGMFVNTQGKINSSIPSDLHMEHMVKKTKGMLKNLGSNKKSSVVIKRSKALAGMDSISHQYDRSTQVIIRSQKHKFKSSKEDENKMIMDIQEVQPFMNQPGRCFQQFQNLTAPLLFSIDRESYRAWIEHHKSILDFDSGK